MIGRSRPRAWFLAVFAVTAMVGGVAPARDPASGRGAVSARSRSAGTRWQGVDIQQSYDRAGDPALIANANVPGDRTRPQWLVCPPANVNACEHVGGVAPKAGPTSEFLNPGDTPGGTVFEATLSTNGHVYSARTAVWLGKVRATSPPTLFGRPRFDTRVAARGATWSGGWSHALAGIDAARGQAANVDELNVEACRTSHGAQCVNLTAQAKSGGFSTKAAVIDSWFTGWYLFAFDHRIAAPFLIAEPGYDSPAVIPTVALDHTVARSAPLGPIDGPRPPKVAFLRQALALGDEVLVAHVRCTVTCRVRLAVDDHRTGSSSRLRLAGERLIGVARRRLRHGRLNLALQVGAGPEIIGHTDFR